MSSCKTSPGSRKREEFPATMLTGTLNGDRTHEGAEAVYVLR
jgi:hypothetical protein